MTSYYSSLFIFTIEINDIPARKLDAECLLTKISKTYQ
jgi:hypothetical protein